MSNAPFFVDNEVIRLTKNGIWIADGVEISHEPTRKLFARSLKHDQEGYFLHVGRETKRIHVEDTAYFVTRVEGRPDGEVELWLSDESREILVPETLSYRPGRLTCRVRRDSGSTEEEAKFLHAAYFDLLRHLQEDDQNYFLLFGREPRAKKIVLSAKNI